MMTFLADPKKSKKHFSPVDAWKKDPAFEENMLAYKEVQTINSTQAATNTTTPTNTTQSGAVSIATSPV
jgi:hypothetical protein